VERVKALCEATGLLTEERVFITLEAMSDPSNVHKLYTIRIRI